MNSSRIASFLVSLPALATIATIAQAQVFVEGSPVAVPGGNHSAPALTPPPVPTGATFDGFVVDWRGRPVDAATVEINQKTTKTDAKGFFALNVPHDPDRSLFIVNVHKPGHALFGRIYDRPANHVLWELPPAIVIPADPNQAISVQGTMPQGACRGALSSRVDWSEHPEAHQPVVVGSNGVRTKVTLSKDLEKAVSTVEAGTHCSPGFQVDIPPGALVDEQGQPPAGEVEITISTVDLFSPNGMPGDLTVDTGDGPMVMESFGAGTIEIYDASGRRYNLRPGAQAQLTIPVDPQQLAYQPVPPTIPLIVYNEKTGAWDVDGTMVLNSSQDAYIATVSHFSAFNADLVKVDQACIRFDSSSIDYDYDVEITIQRPGRAPVVLVRQVDNTPTKLHAVYNLPTNTDVILRPFLTSRSVPIRSDELIPLGTFSVNTGGPQVPTDPNRPDFPYSACQASANIVPLPVGFAIQNRQRYDQLSTFINNVNVSPAVIAPQTGLTLNNSFGVSAGDEVSFVFEHGPANNGVFYTMLGSFIAGPGTNTISPLPIAIGGALSLFGTATDWSGNFFDANALLRTAVFRFDNQTGVQVFIDGTRVGSGTVQVANWVNNSPDVTINLGSICSNQNMTVFDVFDPIGSSLRCNQFNAEGGPYPLLLRR
ncbi:MAG: hypothetical protein AAF449_06180 [Myxococcota bacterium]